MHVASFGIRANIMNVNVNEPATYRFFSKKMSGGYDSPRSLTFTTLNII